MCARVCLRESADTEWVGSYDRVREKRCLVLLQQTLSLTFDGNRLSWRQQHCLNPTFFSSMSMLRSISASPACFLSYVQFPRFPLYGFLLKNRFTGYRCHTKCFAIWHFLLAHGINLSTILLLPVKARWTIRFILGRSCQILLQLRRGYAMVLAVQRPELG